MFRLLPRKKRMERKGTNNRVVGEFREFLGSFPILDLRPKFSYVCNSVCIPSQKLSIFGAALREDFYGPAHQKR